MRQFLVFLVCVPVAICALLAINRRLLAIVKRLWGILKKGETPAPLVEGEGPRVLLTCFERDQLTLLQALDLPPPADTAFDTVVRLSADSKVVYLTPALFEEHVSITRALLGVCDGEAEGREVLSVPMYANAEGERVNVPLREARASIAEAVCLLGLDMAVVPLGPERGALIRAELQRLSDTLGSRLIVLKLHTQVVDGWPAASRAKRFEIWSEVFDGLDLCIHDFPGEG